MWLSNVVQNQYGSQNDHRLRGRSREGEHKDSSEVQIEHKASIAEVVSIVAIDHRTCGFKIKNSERKIQPQNSVDCLPNRPTISANLIRGKT